jgi:hypothetical protein
MNVVDDLILGALVPDSNACDDRRVISTNESDVPAAACSAETESVGLDRPDLRWSVCAHAKGPNRIDVAADAKVKPSQILRFRAAPNEVAASSPSDRLEDRVRLGLHRKSHDH